MSALDGVECLQPGRERNDGRHERQQRPDHDEAHTQACSLVSTLCPLLEPLVLVLVGFVTQRCSAFGPKLWPISQTLVLPGAVGVAVRGDDTSAWSVAERLEHRTLVGRSTCSYPVVSKLSWLGYEIAHPS